MSEIRPYRPEDEAAVVALWEACDLARPWNPPAGDIEFLGRSGHGALLVAEEGGAVIGSIMVGHDGHRGWLYYVAVAPSRQRGGLGAALVQAGEAWLAERGVRKAMLMIRETNTAVAAFYARLGYDAEPRTVMSRWLVDPPP